MARVEGRVTSSRPFSILDQTFTNFQGTLLEAIKQSTSLLDGHLEINLLLRSPLFTVHFIVIIIHQ